MDFCNPMFWKTFLVFRNIKYLIINILMIRIGKLLLFE